MLAGVIAVMGLPWVVMPTLAPPPKADAHVVELERTPRGYRAPFGKGHLELQFVPQDGMARARVELFSASGGRLVPSPETIVHLELPGRGVERTKVPFKRQGSALVSTAPVRELVDRSTLVFEDERVRHVFALDRR